MVQGSFHKMHGLGNDFVVIDARSDPVAMTGALACAIADRRTGIGCDQLILLEASDIADLRMRIFNSDGSEVESCGNAARCVVSLLDRPVRIETAGGLIEGEPDDSGVTVDMGGPRFEWNAIPLAYAMDGSDVPVGWPVGADTLEHGMAVNVGNPHIVFFVEDAYAIALEDVGPRIENDAIFPDRVNVNVGSIRNGEITLRTWERGAGLTRACGTGACATAVAAIKQRRVSSPVRMHLPGGDLEIAWSPGEAIRMTGPAVHVFSGEADWATFL